MYDQFEGAGIAVAALAVDDSVQLQKTQRALDLTYPLLNDTDAAFVTALGLLHKGGNPMDGSDIGRPARLLINRDGRILWSDVSENYRVRPTPQAILEQAQTIAP